MIVCVQQCSKLSYNLIAVNWSAYLKCNIIALNYFLSKGKEYAADIFTGYVSYDYTLKNTKVIFSQKPVFYILNLGAVRTLYIYIMTSTAKCDMIGRIFNHVIFVVGYCFH